MDYSQNKYLAVIFKRTSSYIDHPQSLAGTMASSGLAYVGQIGQLREAHLYSLPLANLDSLDVVLYRLRVTSDVLSVQVQEPKGRLKRGEDL